jgi:hypothetical protein
MAAGRTINCPGCGQEIAYERAADVPAFPFCSVRCRLVDLDKRLEGDYRISGDIADIAQGEQKPPSGGSEDGVGSRASGENS